jgi:predicted CoA-binding protein
MSNAINTGIKEILRSYQNVAIVGISDSPAKASYLVGKYLQKAGFKIYPVNPKYESILGTQCYPELSSIPDTIEIVDIFRNPEYVLPIAQEAIEISAKVIWMQLGIINNEAAEIVLRAGLQVVMDRCIKIEHRRYFPNKL